MARRTPPRPATVPASRPSAPAAAPANPAADSLNAWMHGVAMAAQGSVDWYEQLQRWSLQGVSAWTQALMAGAEEIEQAGDAVGWASVPSRVWNRQFEALSGQLGHAAQEVLDLQRRWAAPAGAPVPAGSTSAAAGAPWPGAAQIQRDWLAATQRWLETVNAVTIQRAGT